MNSFFEITASNQPVLVDFFATWCGPCKAMGPILKEVKDSFGAQVKIIKIDVDKNQRLAASLNVKGVPTLILYKNSSILWRQSGIVQTTEIISKINKHL
jgi:thioredoxin 1